MYRSLFSGDMFAEIDRLQRQLQHAIESSSPGIRGFAGGLPAVNVGLTPGSTEVYAFVPGIDPAQIEVTLERAVLSISGERRPAANGGDAKVTRHSHERYAGRFRRVIGLADDIDPGSVKADCRDGVLHVSAKGLESAQPRRIEVQ